MTLTLVVVGALGVGLTLLCAFVEIAWAYRYSRWGLLAYFVVSNAWFATMFLDLANHHIVALFLRLLAAVLYGYGGPPERFHVGTSALTLSDGAVMILRYLSIPLFTSFAFLLSLLRDPGC